MRVFVFEFVTGGGLFLNGDRWPAEASLMREGAAMLAALVADFSALDEVEQVVICRDRRIDSLPVADEVYVETIRSADELKKTLVEQSRRADWIVPIAPETEGALLAITETMRETGGRLLSSASDAIRLTSNKHATAEFLAAHDIPAPPGILFLPEQMGPPDFPFPAVLKPLDGAGSVGLRKICEPADLRQSRSAPMRLETFCPGIAVSVGVLCGPNLRVPLPACQQNISEDGRFTYLGGIIPLPGPLSQEWNRRAKDLALAALAPIEGLSGYVGVDLVLSEKAETGNDKVIEINPRLTTSYVGLRAAARDNLAGMMIRVAEGERVDLSFAEAAIHFRADGTMLADERKPFLIDSAIN